MYTPGKSGRPQPLPQLTTPTWTQEQFHLHTKGPPESSCGKRQESALHASHNAKLGGSRKGQRREAKSGCHLAGVAARHPSTKHVIFDDLGVSGQGRVSPVLVLTVTVSHDGDCHFPQLVGWGQRHWGEKPVRTSTGGFCLSPPGLTMDMRSSRYPL